MERCALEEERPLRALPSAVTEPANAETLPHFGAVIRQAPASRDIGRDGGDGPGRNSGWEARWHEGALGDALGPGLTSPSPPTKPDPPRDQRPSDYRLHLQQLRLGSAGPGLWAAAAQGDTGSRGLGIRGSRGLGTPRQRRLRAGRPFEPRWCCWPLASREESLTPRGSARPLLYLPTFLQAATKAAPPAAQGQFPLNGRAVW